MMKLVYKLQAEEYKYEFPVSYLPVSVHKKSLCFKELCPLIMFMFRGIHLVFGASSLIYFKV